MNLVESAAKFTKNEFKPTNKQDLRKIEKEVISKYKAIFTLDHIDKLEWEEFRGFTKFSNNRHWSNLHRYNGALEADFARLKVALKLLLDEKIPIKERLERTVSLDGSEKVTGFGPALATAILTVAFPTKYAVYNNPVERAVNRVQSKKYSKSYFAEQYEEFNRYANKIAKDSGLTLWEMDWAWFYVNNNYKKYNLEPNEERSGKSGDNNNSPYSGPTVIEAEDLLFPRNIILYGPVGTGKTFLAKQIAKGIVNDSIQSLQDVRELLEAGLGEKTSEPTGRVKIVTLHKSYGYEQFVEGLRPTTNVSGGTEYVIENGIFKSFCNEASKSLQNGENAKYVLILDEINRADVSRVFGELITLLDMDKRRMSKEVSGTEVELIYSHDLFSVPINLYIIGTMNTTDKSIALMDLAIRRRFHFIEVRPDQKILGSLLDLEGNAEDVQKAIFHIFAKLNDTIESDRGPDYGIGHAYFKDIGSEEDLMDAWNYKIMPLLQEYFYNEDDKLLKLLRSVMKIKEVDGSKAKKIQQYHRLDSASEFLDGVLDSMQKESTPTS